MKDEATFRGDWFRIDLHLLLLLILRPLLLLIIRPPSSFILHPSSLLFGDSSLNEITGRW
jgi:hypothetical protein